MTSSGAREHRLPLAPPGGRPAWAKDGKVILLPTVADVSRIDPRTGRIKGARRPAGRARVVHGGGRLAERESIAYIGGRPLTGPEDGGESVPVVRALPRLDRAQEAAQDCEWHRPGTWLPDGKNVIYITAAS